MSEESNKRTNCKTGPVGLLVTSSPGLRRKANRTSACSEPDNQRSLKACWEESSGPCKMKCPEKVLLRCLRRPSLDSCVLRESSIERKDLTKLALRKSRS